MTELLIGVDLGGTRIRTALLDKQLNIIERIETRTNAHEGKDATIARIKAEIHKILPKAEGIAGIGLSAPGPLNPKTGVVVHPPNLDGWQDVPLGDILHDEFNMPVYIGNDANVAILAEATRGAAQGYRHAIYLTVSTGIGSGILIDGKLLLGREGLAAEAGHMIMLVEDRVSSLELEAAGPDMAMQAVKRIEAGEQSKITEMVQGDMQAVDGSIVGEAAQSGDKLALEIVERSARIVGMGIVNLLHLFNPEIVVVGGGVTNLGEMLFKPMREAVEAHAIDAAYWRDLKITTPDLGGDVSIVGAGALVATKGGADDIANVMKVINEV